ncbi:MULTISPECIES: metal-dependent hydrolase [unclassified Niallia]|uniref:metal-dependent hydrolase n=1 Tax=unclassified Niallia TaxID=2837522 RepID=UPI001EDB6F64|nr:MULTISPECIES: metal-dependent hydrolase [unclassified Niallia]MCM3034105.1 metal-dependent hydrolase [Niallia sp. MER 6]MDL0435466.1 metal-dependent hydrolase [Niallia sp. SS-2023]UPO87649.1 metal-dependent hydrolase [Niallia sp. Man26]
MDTSSHIIMGFGLAALAHIDPVIANQPALSQAVMFGTVIGSNAPDFDFIYRMKGKGSYIRNHRSLSHSLLALPLWSLAVSGIIYAFFPESSFLHLLLWTFLAVILHVLFDLFNVHGTQVLLPFSKKWIAFDSIPLVDPTILFVHLLGFCLLPFYEMGKVFLIIYIFIILYLAVRTLSTVLIKRTLHLHFHHSIRIKLIPRISLFHWDVIIETKEDFLFGVYSNGSLKVDHSLVKKIEYPKIVTDSKSHPLISDFLSSTQYAYPFVLKRKNGYLVYWKDLRFRTNKFFPILAILSVSSDHKIRDCFIGTLYSLKQYKQVIKQLKNTAILKKG